MIEITARRTRPRFTLDVSFRTDIGITALFGPSGAGKSTILNCISGLEQPDAGRIVIDGETLFNSERRIDVPAHRRRIGYVFQDALLFPHLSVRQNLLYGYDGGSIGIDSVIKLLDIAHLINGRPATLSGGERQRVAIGRALLSSPRVLLMDEPLAALDLALKREIMPYIERLNAAFGIPVLYVSHAVDEVARLADTVIVIQNGRVVTTGPPQIVLPPTESGSDRFARISVLAAKLGEYDERYQLTSFIHPAGAFWLAGDLRHGDESRRLVIRATDVTIARTRPDQISARTMLQATISDVEQSATAVIMVHTKLAGGDTLTAALTRKAADELELKTGDSVWCLLKSVSIDERWIAAP